MKSNCLGVRVVRPLGHLLHWRLKAVHIFPPGQVQAFFAHSEESRRIIYLFVIRPFQHVSFTMVRLSLEVTQYCLWMNVAIELKACDAGHTVHKRYMLNRLLALMLR